MILFKNLNLKNIVLSAIAATSALFAILSLLFSTVSLTVFGETEGVSGFKYLFDGGFDFNAFAAVLVLFVFIAAIAILALCVLNLVLTKDIDTYKKGLRLITVANAVSALLYMIAGIVAASESKYYDTAAFVPFIIAVVLTAGYFVSDKLIKD